MITEQELDAMSKLNDIDELRKVMHSLGSEWLDYDSGRITREDEIRSAKIRNAKSWILERIEFLKKEQCTHVITFDEWDDETSRFFERVELCKVLSPKRVQLWDGTKKNLSGKHIKQLTERER